MSFTRPRYDACAYKTTLTESTSVAGYTMDPTKFNHCSPCRMEFGIVGGNNVSIFGGDMVQLESDLRGQTRVASQCPEKKYSPSTVIEGVKTNGCKPGCGKTGVPCGSLSCRQDDLKHLPACNIVDWGKRIDNVGYEIKYPPCPARGTPMAALPSAPRTREYKPSSWQGQIGKLM